MKKLIFSLVILLLSVALGLLIHNHPAYLFVNMGHITVQASLWFAVFALLVGYFLGYQLLRLLRGVYSIPTSLQRLAKHHSWKKSQQLTDKALYAFLETRWAAAEAYFSQSAKIQPQPFFHYVAAGQAAFAQRKLPEANGYLAKAKQVAKPSEVLALEVVRARWQLELKSYAEALVILRPLQSISPKHPFVLKGLKDAYLALQNWPALQELLPHLRRHAGMEPAELERLEQAVWHALLDQAGHLNSTVALEKVWRFVPRQWRRVPSMLARYAKHLIDQNQHPKAEKILQEALAQHLDASLLEQYTRLHSSDSVKQLARVESWLQKNNQNADLLFCLGKLCARYRLWGKAKNYLEMSLKRQACSDVYPLLGEVLEQLNEKPAALACYKAGMNFLSGKYVVPPKGKCGFLP